MRWVSRALADRSSLIHWVSASSCSGVGAAGRIARIAVPSKYPHKPLASMASWKRMANAVQFKPVGMSFGTEEGRRSVVMSAVIGIGTIGAYWSRECRGPITCKNIKLYE